MLSPGTRFRHHSVSVCCLQAPVYIARGARVNMDVNRVRPANTGIIEVTVPVIQVSFKILFHAETYNVM